MVSKWFCPMFVENVYVLIGVDIGVGKTHVVVGLFSVARWLGIDAIGIKFVEFGCDVFEAVDEDGAQLALVLG